MPPPSRVKAAPPSRGPVRIAFAAASARVNRAALLRFAAESSSFPLLVVSEFEPVGVPCHWIPFHVHRSLAENHAYLEATLSKHKIVAAALFVSPGTAMSPLRWLAFRLTWGRFVLYDTELRPIRWYGWPYWLARQAGALLLGQLSANGRARKWLYRLFHPSDAEIPIRARLAQFRGRLASRHANRRPDSPGPMPPGALPSGITVVIPSRDGRDLLAALLPALLPQLAAGEVIVTDNGSTDGTREWLSESYPSVRVIESVKPLSFAAAVNAGIAEARFSHLLMLNNDMVPEPGFIAALEAAFVSISGLYCATAQIFFPPGIRREETGKAVWRKDGPLDFPVRCDDPLPGEDLTWVLYGSGGCSLFDTAMLRDLGGVSALYDPAYVEDMDFGYRAWKRGWPTVFVAGAKVLHCHRATTSRFYTAKDLDFFVERNYLRFLETAIADPGLFADLWSQAIRRLQLRHDLRALRGAPRIGARPPEPTGLLTESQILALGNGDAAAFQGREARPGCRRVIIASPYIPYPLSHGGAVRIFNLMTQAAARNDLVLVAFVDALAPPPAELLELCCEVVLVRRHGSHYRVQTERPDVVEEFESETFRASLKQAAWRWNAAIVQLEFTWLAQYAGQYGHAKTILVEHDITFDLQRQLLAARATDWELEKQYKKWETFETVAWSRVDCVVTMSEKDQAAVTGASRVVTLPNGVDCERFRSHNANPDPKRLLFIGSFAHRPNVLGLEWFLSEVWPLLSGYKLHIISGRDPHLYTKLDLSGPDFELEAFVPDVRPAYELAAIVLAPLVASAGTNIKVLEAMAMSRVIIGTDAGFHGLPLRPEEDCLLANTGSEMAAAINRASSDAALRQHVGSAARDTAETFDWNVIGKLQGRFYDDLSSSV